jgi:hypothetical protein
MSRDLLGIGHKLRSVQRFVEAIWKPLKLFFFSYKKGKDDKKILRDEIYGIPSSEAKNLFTPLRISGFAPKFQPVQKH